MDELRLSELKPKVPSLARELMDIFTFRQLVDESSRLIAEWPSDLIEQYHFLRLPLTDDFSAHFIGEYLYHRIRGAFSPGNMKIADQCVILIAELIYDQVLDGRPVKPYCEILAKIKDATQSDQTTGNDTREEWRRAIENAHLSVQQMSLNTAENLIRLYPSYYAVGLATTRLRSIGFLIDRDGSKMTLNNDTELRLVKL